jgi:ribonucleoside-diphosphate reductase beta chain
MNQEIQEFLLNPNEERYVLKVKYKDIDFFYQKHKESFWTPNEIDFSRDIIDWEKMSENEKYFIKHVLAFFAASDGIVSENLVNNFSEIQLPEARSFLAIQIAMETIHSETYSKILEVLVSDEEEQSILLNAINNFSAIKKKAMWALKWTDRSKASFTERLIAFIAVEGIFFSGSFCSIFWLKSKGLLPGLCFSNELISRDEGLHCEFAIHLYNNYIENKLSEKRIKEILISAFETEEEFISESLPVSLIGMNNSSMKEYLQFITDRLLLQLNCSKVFNTKNPFSFMEMISLEGMTNFFEKRVSEYKKPTSQNFKIIDVFDDDF